MQDLEDVGPTVHVTIRSQQKKEKIAYSLLIENKAATSKFKIQNYTYQEFTLFALLPS